MDFTDIIDRIKTEYQGFIVSDDIMAKLVAKHPFQRLLVRCGGGRFVVPAQDADHFMKIITKEGSDYVRDVSLAINYPCII